MQRSLARVYISITRERGAERNVILRIWHLTLSILYIYIFFYGCNFLESRSVVGKLKQDMLVKHPLGSHRAVQRPCSVTENISFRKKRVMNSQSDKMHTRIFYFSLELLLEQS